MLFLYIHFVYMDHQLVGIITFFFAGDMQP